VNTTDFELKNMKKTLILTISLCLSVLMLVAQEATTVNGKIIGSVIDAENNQPVEFANIALIDPKTGKPVDGGVADGQGKFTINRVAEGTYTVSISFIGYETTTINGIIISDKKGEVNLGIIKLGTSAKVLSEVVVETQRQLIEERVDRTIYNAENDATARGGDATDVLKRVPMLSVDMDGNVSMRGSQNITVLINNKPSTIMAANIGDALKQIPAEEIKSVEVITSPSAKYDAEGSAGIINIITKKNTIKGFTLNVNAGVGNRGSNLGLNGNFRTNKMGFSLGGFGRANYNIDGSFKSTQTTYQNFADNTPTINVQSAETLNRGLFGNYTIGWDYDIDKNNSLVASARFGARNGTSFQDNLLTVIDGVPSSLRNTESNNINNSMDLSLTYTRLFEKPQREFSILGNYSQNNGNNDFENFIKQVDGVDDPSGIRNLNDSYNKEMTLQLDYQTPISDNQILEFGGKDIVRRVYSDFSLLTDSDGDGTYQLSTDGRLTNNLNYDQNIVAGYMSYTYTTKSAFSVKAGGRYEYTSISAYDVEKDIEIPEYGAFVPSINVSKRLKSGKTIKASYNRRIQRPSIRFLNPNIQAANPYDVTLGNPQLDPEYSNNYELSYSTFVKSTNINIAAFWRNTNNGIQSVRNVIAFNNADPDTIQTTYRNIGQEDAVGLNLNANVTIGKLTLSGGGDFYYSMLDNNLPIDPNDPEDPNRQNSASNSGWVMSGRVFGGYNLGKGWNLQLFSFFRGRQVQLQGYQGGMGMYNLGIRKDFNDKKGSIGLGAQNFFTTEMKIKSEVNSPLASRASENILRNMGFNITFSYRLGKMSTDGGRTGRRRSVNNDDLKDGGDGGGMDGGNMMQQGGAAGGGAGGNGNQRMGGAMPQMAAGNAAKTTTPAPADTAKATVDAAGTWAYTMETPQGTQSGSFAITKDGDKYTGYATSMRNNQQIPFTSVTVSGNELTATYTVNFSGNEMQVIIKGPITGDDFDGTMSFGTFRTTPLKAKRSK
jgi:outer membrane receptor protein involved in Fe transport